MMTAVLMVGWEWSLRLEDAGLGEGMPNTVQLVADPGLSNISGRNLMAIRRPGLTPKPTMSQRGASLRPGPKAVRLCRPVIIRLQCCGRLARAAFAVSGSDHQLLEKNDRAGSEAGATFLVIGHCRHDHFRKLHLFRADCSPTRTKAHPHRRCADRHRRKPAWRYHGTRRPANGGDRGEPARTRP
jgi:hypothetical protein